MKSFRWTWIFAVVVIGLVVFSVHDFKKSENEDEQKEKDKTVVSIATPDVAHIEISSNGKVDTVLDKKDGVWKMQKPIPDEADADAMTSFLLSLSNEKTLSTVVEGEDLNLATYGLEHPVKELVVTSDKGVVSDVKIGTIKAYDGNLYALVGKNKVELVSSSWDAHLSKRPDDFRDKHILRQNLKFPDVKAIEIERAGQPVVRAALDGKSWKLTKGGLDYPVLPTHVETYFDEIKNARLQSFTGPTKANLKPALTVRLFKDGEKAAFTAEFAAPPTAKPEPGHPVVTEASSSDLPDRLSVQKATMDGLKKDANYFYDRKRSFEFDPNEVASLVIDTPELKNTFKKSGDTWTAEKTSDGKTVDSAKITAAIDHLSHIEPVRVLAPLAKRNLSGAISKLKLLKADGSELFTIEWAAPITDSVDGVEARYLPVRTNRIDFLMGVTENEVKSLAFGDWYKAPAPSPTPAPTHEH